MDEIGEGLAVEFAMVASPKGSIVPDVSTVFTVFVPNVDSNALIELL